MNSKIFVSIALILSIVTCAILGTVNASAFEQQEINLSAANSTQSYVTMDDGYLYREVEPNDSIATANIRISSDGQRVDERVLIGYVSPQDSVDFFEIYVQSGHTYRIKLTPYRSTPNLDLFLYDNSNTLISPSQATAVDQDRKEISALPESTVSTLTHTEKQTVQQNKSNQDGCHLYSIFSPEKQVPFYYHFRLFHFPFLPLFPSHLIRTVKQIIFPG